MTIRKMSEICRVLEKTEKAVRYEWFAGKMKSAIQKAILQAGLLPDHLMGAYVLAFAFESCSG